MRTLFRFTTPNGRNLLTAAVAPAPGNTHTLLFVWIGLNCRCSIIPLYRYGARLFRYPTSFRARVWKLRASVTRDTLAVTLHAGFSGWLLTLGRIYRGRTFAYCDARGGSVMDSPPEFRHQRLGIVRAFRAGTVNYLLVGRLGFACAWLTPRIARTVGGFTCSRAGISLVLGRAFGMAWLAPRGAR